MESWQVGHRKRLKTQILDYGIHSKKDLIEAILFFSIQRKNTKDIAFNLLTQFKTITNILYFNIQDMKNIEGLGTNTILFLQLLKSMCEFLLKEKIDQKDVINNWDDLIKYLSFSKTNLKNEEFSILFLNAKNFLIKEEKLEGSVSFVSLNLRDLLKKCLEIPCTKIIFVHNHPSGSTSPSREDLEITRKMKSLLHQIDIELFDHVIVAADSYYSFKSSGLI